MKLGIFVDYSAYNNNLTQAQIEQAVYNITSAVPNAEYLVIGTSPDYSSQRVLWYNAIHAAGKKVWDRSFGTNIITGLFGATIDDSLTTLSDYRSTTVAFINANPTIFRSGDIFQCPPDEPENWTGWDANYAGVTTVDGKAAYNQFIQDCITDAEAAFAANGIKGVETRHSVGTNPYVSRSVINSTTAALMKAMCVDSYVDGGTSAYPWVAVLDPHQSAEATKAYIQTHMNISQGGKPYHYTMGVNKWIALTEHQQMINIASQIYAIIKNIRILDGITYYPMGRGTSSTDSQLSYLNSGVWTIKTKSTNVLNEYFGLLKEFGQNYVRSQRRLIFY